MRSNMNHPTSRPRRLIAAGALLSVAALGSVFSVQAMASGKTSEAKTSAPASQQRGTDESRLGSEAADRPGKGPHFALAIQLKADDIDAVEQAAGQYTGCMRDQGLKGSPEFEVTAGEDAGLVRLELRLNGKHLDPASKRFQKAHRACASIWKDAGVDFPDLPVPPRGPDAPHPSEPGPRPAPLRVGEAEDSVSGISV